MAVVRREDQKNWTEIAAYLYAFAQTDMATIGADFGRNSDIVIPRRFCMMFFPYVHDEVVPMSPLFRRKEMCSALLEELYAQIDIVEQNGRVPWKRVVSYLHDAFIKWFGGYGPRAVQAVRHRQRKGKWLPGGTSDTQMANYANIVSTRSFGNLLFAITSSMVFCVIDTESSWKCVAKHCSAAVETPLKTIKCDVVPIEGLLAPVAFEHISPGNCLVLSARSSMGGTLMMLDVATKYRCMRRTDTYEPQECMRWAGATSGRLLSGTRLGEITSWDVTVEPPGITNRVCKTIHRGAVLDVQCLALPGIAVSAGRHDGCLTLFDVHQLLVFRSIAAHESGIVSMAYDRLLHLIAAVGDGTAAVRVFHASLPPKCTHADLIDTGPHPHEHVVCSVVSNPELCQFVTLDVKGDIKIWDARALVCIETHSSRLANTVQKTAEWKHLSIIHERLFVSCSDVSMTTFECKGTQEENTKRQCDVYPVSTILFDADSRSIVTIAKNGVKVWSTETGDMQTTYDSATQADVSAASISAAGRFLYLGTTTGALSKFDLLSGITVLHFEGVHKGAVRMVECLPCQAIVSCGDDHVCVATDVLVTGGDRYIVVDELHLRASSFLSENNILAVLTQNTQLYVWDGAKILPRTGLTPPRVYNIMPSLRYKMPPPDFCLFPTHGMLIVPDAGDVSIIALSSIKTTRVASWSSAGGRQITALTFIQRDNLLVTLEESGGVSAFALDRCMKVVGEGKSTGALSDLPPPSISLSFRPLSAGTVTAFAAIPELSAVVTANSELEGIVHSLKGGACIGPLDMTNNSTGEWCAELVSDGEDDPISPTTLAASARRKSFAGAKKFQSWRMRQRSTLPVGSLVDLTAALDEPVLDRVSSLSICIPEIRVTHFASASRIKPKHTEKLYRGTNVYQRERPPLHSKLPGLIPQRALSPERERLTAAESHLARIAEHALHRETIASNMLKSSSKEAPIEAENLKSRFEISNRTTEVILERTAKWTLDTPPQTPHSEGLIPSVERAARTLLPSRKLVEAHNRVMQKRRRFVSSPSPPPDDPPIMELDSPPLDTRERPLFLNQNSNTRLPLISEVTPPGGGSDSRPQAKTPTLHSSSLSTAVPQWMKHRVTRIPVGGGFAVRAPLTKP